MDAIRVVDYLGLKIFGIGINANTYYHPVYRDVENKYEFNPGRQPLNIDFMMTNDTRDFDVNKIPKNFSAYNNGYRYVKDITVKDMARFRYTKTHWIDDLCKIDTRLNWPSDHNMICAKPVLTASELKQLKLENDRNREIELEKRKRENEQYDREQREALNAMSLKLKQRLIEERQRLIEEQKHREEQKSSTEDKSDIPTEDKSESESDIEKSPTEDKSDIEKSLTEDKLEHDETKHDERKHSRKRERDETKHDERKHSRKRERDELKHLDYKLRQLDYKLRQLDYESDYDHGNFNYNYHELKLSK